MEKYLVNYKQPDIKQIYLDMDGVLSDFDKQCKLLFKIDESYTGTIEEYSKMIGKTKFWNTLRNAENFWSSMEPITDSIESFKQLCKLYPITILSSPDKGDPKCIPQKNKWIDEHLGTTVPRIFESKKYKYAKATNLLIDDMPKNTEPWVDHGGVVILFKDWKSTLEQVNKYKREA